MAFVGAAVFENVTNHLVRITGLSLDVLGEVDPPNTPPGRGTIGLDGSGADVELPAAFQPSDYGDVTLSESVEVSIILVSAEAVAPAVQIVKIDGPPFIIALTNNGAAATGDLEIYVRFH